MPRQKQYRGPSAQSSRELSQLSQTIIIFKQQYCFSEENNKEVKIQQHKKNQYVINKNSFNEADAKKLQNVQNNKVQQLQIVYYQDNEQKRQKLESKKCNRQTEKYLHKYKNNYHEQAELNQNEDQYNENNENNENYQNRRVEQNQDEHQDNTNRQAEENQQHLNCCQKLLNISKNHPFLTVIAIFIIALSIAIYPILLQTTCLFRNNPGCQQQKKYMINPLVRFTQYQCNRHDYHITSKDSIINSTQNQGNQLSQNLDSNNTETITSIFYKMFYCTTNVDVNKGIINISATFQQLPESNYSDMMNTGAMIPTIIQQLNQTSWAALWFVPNTMSFYPNPQPIMNKDPKGYFKNGKNTSDMSFQNPQFVIKIVKFSINFKGQLLDITFPKRLPLQYQRHLLSILETYSPNVDATLYSEKEKTQQLKEGSQLFISKTMHKQVNANKFENNYTYEQSDGKISLLKNRNEASANPQGQKIQSSIIQNKFQNDVLKQASVSSTSVIKSKKYNQSSGEKKPNLELDAAISVQQKLESKFMYSKTTKQKNIIFFNELLSINESVTYTPEQLKQKLSGQIVNDNYQRRRLLQQKNSENNLSFIRKSSNSQLTFSGHLIAEMSIQIYDNVQYVLKPVVEGNLLKQKAFIKIQTGITIRIGNFQKNETLDVTFVELDQMSQAYTLRQIQSTILDLKNEFNQEFSKVLNLITETETLQQFMNQQKNYNNTLKQLLIIVKEQYSDLNPNDSIQQIIQIMQQKKQQLENLQLSNRLENDQIEINETQSLIQDYYYRFINGASLGWNSAVEKIKTIKQSALLVIQQHMNSFRNESLSILDQVQMLVPQQQIQKFNKQMKKAGIIIKNKEDIQSGVSFYYDILIQNKNLFKDNFLQFATKLLNLYLQNIQTPLYEIFWNNYINTWNTLFNQDISLVDSAFSQILNGIDNDVIQNITDIIANYNFSQGNWQQQITQIFQNAKLHAIDVAVGVIYCCRQIRN